MKSDEGFSDMLNKTILIDYQYENNKGNYVLATGDIEKFGPFVIAKLPFILPKINKKFWDEVKC